MRCRTHESALRGTPQCSDTQRVDLSELTLASFQPCIGTQFVVTDVDDLVLTLEEATPIGGNDGLSFSLVFVASENATAPQRIYAFRHEALGTFSMFIVPLGPAPDRKMRYQAVFSRASR